MPEDRVKNIAMICYQISNEATGVIEFLEAGNTPEVEAALDKTIKPLAIIIKKAMFERLLMGIMRMHDKPASDCETLPRAFNLLRDEQVFQRLSVQGDAVCLRSAATRWDQLANDPRVVAIRNTRNFDVAHIIPSGQGSPRPCIAELLDVARETMKVVEYLATGTGICSVSLDTAAQVWAGRAQAYWSRFTIT